MTNTPRRPCLLSAPTRLVGGRVSARMCPLSH
jgi:hypothetical protein